MISLKTYLVLSQLTRPGFHMTTRLQWNPETKIWHRPDGYQITSTYTQERYYCSGQLGDYLFRKKLVIRKDGKITPEGRDLLRQAGAFLNKIPS